MEIYNGAEIGVNKNFVYSVDGSGIFLAELKMYNEAISITILLKTLIFHYFVPKKRLEYFERITEDSIIILYKFLMKLSSLS